jgi:hypothetical protein
MLSSLALCRVLTVASEVRVEVRVSGGTEKEPGEKGEEENGEDGGEVAAVFHELTIRRFGSKAKGG